MRRLHLLSSDRPNPDGGDKPGPDDPVTRGLRDLYAAPSEGYWDSLEARVMAAVRASRGAPQAVAEWWHTLAAWAGRGVAAACLLLAIAGMAAMQARAVRTASDRAAHRAREIEPLDADLARALDLVETGRETPDEAKEAREAADLLIDGVYRRPSIARPSTRSTRPAADTDDRDEVLRARREATFRYVMP